MKIAYRPIVVAVCCAVIGCTDDDGESREYLIHPSARVQQSSAGSVVTDSQGRTSITFTISETVSAFQIVAFFARGQGRLLQVQRTGGEIIFNADSDLSFGSTRAGIAQASPITFNYPITPDIGDIAPGTFKADFEMFLNEAGIPLHVVVLTKSDRASVAGVLPINVIFTGAVAFAEENRFAIEDALSKSSEIFVRAGIHLNISRFNIAEAPDIMPDPRFGDPLYEELAKVLPPGVNVYMATNIQGFSGRNFNYGLAGSTPGAYIPSPRSAVVLSISAAAGPDGEFNASGEDQVSHNRKDLDRGDEVRMLSESINLAVFNYLGLVELLTFSGDTVVDSDGLVTPKCTVRRACEDESSVRENVMYPEPVQGWIRSGTTNRGDTRFFYPRKIVEPAQRSLLNRWVGVR